MASSLNPVCIAKGLLGAAVGGVIGFYLFQWALTQGFYALALPGALLGIGCGYLSGTRSIVLGSVCAVAAVGLCLFCEYQLWQNTYPTFGEFVAQIGSSKPVTKLMILLGGVFGFWFGLGRDRFVQRPQHAPPDGNE